MFILKEGKQMENTRFERVYHVIQYVTAFKPFRCHPAKKKDAMISG